MNHQFNLSSLEATAYLAKSVAESIVSNFVITLNGNLGAGKTTLTREVLRAYGITGSIKSPTFTLVEPYTVNGLNIYHFDLYRFSDPEEWFEAGFDEYFVRDHICFIEWAEKAEGLIPRIDWEISIQAISENERILNVNALTDKGDKCLRNLIVNAAI